jgi:hypothetical protein
VNADLTDGLNSVYEQANSARTALAFEAERQGRLGRSRAARGQDQITRDPGTHNQGLTVPANLDSGSKALLVCPASETTRGSLQLRKRWRALRDR